MKEDVEYLFANSHFGLNFNKPFIYVFARSLSLAVVFIPAFDL